MANSVLIRENEIRDIVRRTVSKFLVREYSSDQRLPFDDDQFKNKNNLEQYLDWLEDFGKYGTLPGSTEDFWEGVSEAARYIVDKKLTSRGEYDFSASAPSEIIDELRDNVIKDRLEFNENGNLYVERQIKINGSIGDYGSTSEKGEDPIRLYKSLVSNYQNNVGGCWSYKMGAAESYCSTSTGDSIILKGYIRTDDINFVKTVLLNLYYSDEYEIRVKPNAKVELFEVVCNCKYKMPLKGHLIVNATYFGNNKGYKGEYAPVDDGFGNRDYVDRKGNIKSITKMVEDLISSGKRLEDIFDSVSRFSDSLLRVEFYDKFSLITKDGKLIGDGKLWFDSISGILNGFARVENNGKFTLMEKDGKLIGDGKLWFDKIISFEGKYFKVKSRGKYTLVTLDGKLIGDGKLWFDSIGKFNMGLAEVSLDLRYSLLREDDGELIGGGDAWFDDIYPFSNGLAKVRRLDSYSLIRTDGSLIGSEGGEWFDYISTFVNGFAQVDIGDKSTFIGTNGELIGGGKLLFDDVFDFREGIAEVQIDGKWNLLGEDGKLLSPSQWFDGVGIVKDGLVEVLLGGKHNFMDKHGKYLFPYIWFDKVTRFDGGKAQAMINNTNYIIDVNGNIKEA